ncbi:MAG: cyclic nucleotide-binding domain-containing protein [Gammaproteobacteria bacterium]|nr:cyclic nucleotide-binding domain-containing protein [Gammaproteobacteria bacterium]
MTKKVDREFLKTLTPLNGLKPENQVDIANKTEIQELGAGRYLFKEGDADDRTIYVVKGEVEIRKGDNVVKTVKAGTPEAKHPVAPQNPRQFSVRAGNDIEYIAVDSNLLDIMLTWDQTGSFEVGELETEEEDGDDWMATILQTKAFHKIPPANIQAMFMRMQPVTKSAGETVIKQGEEGDYFYIITQGNCVVTREMPNGKAIKLAELTVGDSFGEEALISDAKRNATITMTTNGQLMRLGKEDFTVLLNEPMLNWVSGDEAKDMVSKGAKWLDVRLPTEHENFEEKDKAVNIPLYFIRIKLKDLDESTPYVVVCDTGRRSSAAAYILSERGFQVAVLKDGLHSLTA